MPRQPTIYARRAREHLIGRAARHPEDTPLPPLRALAKEYDVHQATVFRILRDLVTEGIFWQSPSGRFFPAAARKTNLRGAPLCFVGREVWQWSRLYQELLEGVSEVAAANGSPFLLLTSRSLVRQGTPVDAPAFASVRAQAGELATLLTAVPKGCGGFILDHLWKSSALAKVRFPSGERVQVLHGDSRDAAVAAPDTHVGAAMAAAFATEQNFRRIALILPFVGDPAIDSAVESLRKALAGLSVTEVPYRELLDQRRTLAALTRQADLLVCPEDNIAQALAQALSPFAKKPQIIGTQGTGVLHAPQARLRYDYRRLGRSAASRILHGTELPSLRPLLVGPLSA